MFLCLAYQFCIISHKEAFASLWDAFVWKQGGDVRHAGSDAEKPIFESTTSSFSVRAAVVLLRKRPDCTLNCHTDEKPRREDLFSDLTMF